LKYLDRLEEILISFLMGAATLLIFVAVLHRYAAGWPIPGVQDALLKIDLSWAQELCVYMFVWMAKFGAAYGVRTGIHVGVGADQPATGSDAQGVVVLFGLLAPRSPSSSARWARNSRGDRADELDLTDLEIQKWIVYLCIPPVHLMCFRCSRVALCRPVSCRDVAHVEGIDETVDLNPYNLADNLHPADVRPGGRP
jgi:C4-dicarboxylate transporter DctQ subunit